MADLIRKNFECMEVTRMQSYPKVSMSSWQKCGFLDGKEKSTIKRSLVIESFDRSLFAACISPDAADHVQTTTSDGPAWLMQCSMISINENCPFVNPYISHPGYKSPIAVLAFSQLTARTVFRRVRVLLNTVGASSVFKDFLGFFDIFPPVWHTSCNITPTP